jgi:hypothetical protein
MRRKRQLSVLLVLMYLATGPGLVRAEEPPVDLRELVVRTRSLVDGQETGDALPEDGRTLTRASSPAGSACDVSPASLDFGTVGVGSSSDLTFVISNTGDTILSGVVSESCDHYLFFSGGG